MDPRRRGDLVPGLPSPPRRSVLTGLAAEMLTALPLAPGWDAEAVKHKTDMRKKINRNKFGGVEVSKACRGKDAKCCSSICSSKKPKNGKRDKSTCVGPDAGTCLSAHDVTDCDEADNERCTTSAELEGRCVGIGGCDFKGPA